MAASKFFHLKFRVPVAILVARRRDQGKRCTLLYRILLRISRQYAAALVPRYGAPGGEKTFGRGTSMAASKFFHLIYQVPVAIPAFARRRDQGKRCTLLYRTLLRI